MDALELNAMSKRIKKRRKQLGFTQEQMAEKIDLTSSSYTKIENAFQTPSLRTLNKISLVLHISLDYIVFGEEISGSEQSKTDSAVLATIHSLKKESLKDTIDLLQTIDTHLF